MAERTERGQAAGRSPPPVLVVGCGNPDAGDDAAGLLAVRLARPSLERNGRSGHRVDVVEVGPAVRVLDLLEGRGAVVIVDAVRTRGGRRRPGSIVRFESARGHVPSGLGATLSSHGLGLAASLGVAAALGGPARLVFLGVEAGRVEAGRPLSPAVAGAVPRLAQKIEAEVARLLEGPGP